MRWMGGNALVSASTDNALKVWDVARGVGADARHHTWRPTTTLTGARAQLPLLHDRAHLQVGLSRGSAQLYIVEKK